MKNVYRRILILEDEVEIAKLYQEILCPPPKVSGMRSSRSLPMNTSEGTPLEPEFEVVVAHHPDEALRHVQESLVNGEPFAMGFFDVMLGADRDGIEAAREILKVDPQLLVVFVTAYHDRSVDSIKKTFSGIEPSHWDYLTKPFHAGEILQKARNYCDLWNMLRNQESHEAELAEAHKKLLEFERATSVAAVARGVSHEFGNILMQIMGKADLARTKSPEEMKKSFDLILDASVKASEILDKFKDLAQTEKRQIEKEKWILLDVVNKAVDLMEHTLKTANVKVSVEGSEDIFVYAHSTSLLQVLVNLTINAVHAMPSGGQIRYQIQRENDESILLTIEDTGPGVPEHLLTKVTEAFFTTKGKKGTGLGLAICREIIEIEHLGQFRLSNLKPHGLKISIELPIGEKTRGES